MIALISTVDDPPPARDRRAMGAAGALRVIHDVANSARLLVLTATDLWEVQAAGRMSGNRVGGINTPLAEIRDFGARVDRSITTLGVRKPYLLIEHARGAQVADRRYLLPSEASLKAFAKRLGDQLERVRGDL